VIDYRGKTALITGGASGIGRALAKALAVRGANVVLADVNEDLLHKTAGEIGANASAAVADLAKTGEPAHLVDLCYEKHGRLDLICSNAGLGRGKRLLRETIDADVERLFAVNLFAGLYFAQAYAERLAKGDVRGHLLFTGSENSLSVPSAVRRSRLGLYGVTKHGILAIAEWLQAEIADLPLDLHILMPGAVYTPLVARNLPDPAKAPPELELIMPERCAELALKGVDLGLFYIPTQPHLAADMAPRTKGVADALKALGLS
jgi:NAD(P)-dependent dehydrogenase (short-subunit alcohol dehydrogenase family)